MKKYFTLLVLFMYFVSSANSQMLNPYNDFGYIPQNKYITTAKAYAVENKDTTDNISKLVIDVDKKLALLYARDSSLVMQVSVTERDILRFLSIDPLTKTYPWYTPYQFAGNKPIWATDLDGLEENTTSTYVYHPPVLAIKPTFAGVINITDATTQTAHKTFSGNFMQLRRADSRGMASSIVSQLTGSNIGTSASALDITMTGRRSQVSKTWKGTDIRYFTQYSYSFTSNNVTEKGSFELQSGQIQASARAWDPLTFLLLNKVVSSIVITAARVGGAAATEEMVTLYRSISRAEAESIQTTKQLSFAEGQMEAKQFWQTKEGLGKFNSSGFGGGI